MEGIQPEQRSLPVPIVPSLTHLTLEGHPTPATAKVHLPLSRDVVVLTIEKPDNSIVHIHMTPIEAELIGISLADTGRELGKRRPA
jgi:hypothetical protein